MTTCTASLITRYRHPVPELRLCVANTEMAVLRRPGEPTLLATAAYSNYEGQLVILDLEGSHRTVKAPGAGLMIQADEDGRVLYGSRSIRRYDPFRDQDEVLVENVIPPGDGIWGGGHTRDWFVVGGSTPEGVLAIVSRKTNKVVKRMAPVHRNAFYTYRVIEAPDGYIVVQSSLPQCVLTRIHPETLELEQIQPECLKPFTNHHGGQFLSPDTFYLHAGPRAFLFSYPDFRLKTEIPAPEGEGVSAWSRKTALLDGQVLAWGLGTNKLYSLNHEKGQWSALTEKSVLPVDPKTPEGCDAFAVLEDGSVAGLTRGCDFFRIRRGTGEATVRPLNITGLVNAQAMRVAGNGKARKIYGSSHVLQRFFEVDAESGEGRDCGDSGPGGGQINDMAWDAQRNKLYMASYTSCTLLEYDPLQKGCFPENPRVIAKVGHGQMRPLMILQAEEGRHVWMISSPSYGTLGGALSRIDPESGEVQVIRPLVPDHTPTWMALSKDGEKLLLTTTVEGDCGSQHPTQPSAALVVFDIKSMQVERIKIPFEGVERLMGLMTLSDGRILFQQGPLMAPGAVLCIWDPKNKDAIERIGEAPERLREVFPGPDGETLWATGGAGIGPLVLGDPSRIDSQLEEGFLKTASAGMAKFCQWSNGVLWASLGTEVAGFEIKD